MNAHKLILTYELLGMLEMNIYLIRPSERKKMAPYVQLETNIAESSTANFRTPMTIVHSREILDQGFFIIGKE